MNKVLTGLSVWTMFLFLMGMLFPIQTTNGASSVGMVLQSYTIYGFFSLTPIVFYGSVVSFVSDWLAKRINKYFHLYSFLFHVTAASLVYIVTKNIDVTIMAVLAAIMFFLADRCFFLLSKAPSVMTAHTLKNLPIVLGFVGVTAMVLGSATG
ncbi:hypothetical protein [Alteribacillus sp. HJP-4]|uniref:hypothetical protein n=1 Tax=Alteribacillus sp. HJP-4 TaxID=2775394 RepID=UPI0035CCDCC2